MTAAIVQKYHKRDVPWLLAKAERVFNAWIRARDAEGEYFKCISCRKYKHVSDQHAGHYMSAGHHASVRFNEKNVWSQCDYCNRHLHSNAIQYRQSLVEKIGEDEVKKLEVFGKRAHKWEKIELIDIIERYSGKP